MNSLCGIDEAGRGPLAGPLVIAGVILKKEILNLDDSKKLTPKKREELYHKIVLSSDYYIVFLSSNLIDKKGLSYCISKGLKTIQEKLPNNNYLFDGNSTFGVKNLKTLVKADTKIASVSGASILAKVSRDKIMQNYSKYYENHNFSKHKGYPTKEHREEIQKYGLTKIHRKSFKTKKLFSV